MNMPARLFGRKERVDGGLDSKVQFRMGAGDEALDWVAIG